MAGEIRSYDFFFDGGTDNAAFLTPRVFFDRGVEVLVRVPNTLAFFENGNAVVVTRGSSPFPTELRDALRGEGESNIQSFVKGPDGLFYAVKTVDSPTQFTLHRAYAGADAEDVPVEEARPFRSQGILFSNDDAVDIEFSYDGSYVSGRIQAGETLLFDHRRASAVFLRSVGPGGHLCRAWAW